MKPTTPARDQDVSTAITVRIEELGDWRAEVLTRVRQLIHDADPAVQEKLKWRGTPTWCHDGIICTGESYKQAVKLTFARGAALPDPKGLFNATLDGNVRRALELHEGDKLNATAFKQLIRAAVAANTAFVNRPKPSKK